MYRPNPTMASNFVALANLFLMASISLAGTPGVPSPENSSVQPWDSLNGAFFSPGTHGNDLVTITVRDGNDVPLPNTQISITLGPNHCVPDEPNLSGTTDQSGILVLDPRVGGCSHNVPLVALVHASGITIRAYANAKSPDYDANGVVDADDFAQFEDEFLGHAPAECFDFDNNGVVGTLDLSLFSEAYNYPDENCPSTQGVSAGRPSWKTPTLRRAEETEYNRRLFVNRLRFRRIGDLAGKGDVFFNFVGKPLDNEACKECTQYEVYPPSAASGPIKMKDSKNRCGWDDDPDCFTNSGSDTPACNWKFITRHDKDRGLLVYNDLESSAEPFSPDIFPELNLFVEAFDVNRNFKEAVGEAEEFLTNTEKCIEEWGDSSGVSIPLNECAKAAASFARFINELSNMQYDTKKPKSLGRLPVVFSLEDYDFDCINEVFSDTRGDRPARAELVLQYKTGNKTIQWEAPGLLAREGSADAIRSFRHTQVGGSQLRFDIEVELPSLKDPSSFSQRSITIPIDADGNINTGFPDEPFCGAEYYIELLQDSDGSVIDQSASLYCWTDCEPCGARSHWELQPETPYRLRYTDWGSQVFIDQSWIDNSSGNLTSWAILEVDGIRTSTAPSSPCTERLVLPIEPDVICPEVVSLEAEVDNQGRVVAYVATFSEPMTTITASDIAFQPAIGFSVSHAQGDITARIEPLTTVFAAGLYTLVLRDTIEDRNGNPIDGDNDLACGGDYLVDLCTPDVDFYASRPEGGTDTHFDLDEEVWVAGSGFPAGTATIYLMPAGELLGDGEILVDLTSDGPTDVFGSSFFESIGRGLIPMDYNLVADLNGNGTFEAATDRAGNWCAPSVFVGEQCVGDESGAAIAWWPMENSLTSTVAELSGHHGASSNLAYGSGIVGNAGQFGGDSVGVVVPHHDDLVIAEDDFSVAFWLERAPAASEAIVLEHCDDLNGYSVSVSPDGHVSLRLRNDGSEGVFATTSALPIGEWTFVAITVDRDKTNGLSMFLNEQLDSTFDPTAFSGSLAATTNLTIGHSLRPEGRLQGRLDELAIFSEALEGTAISSFYSFQQAGARCPEELNDATGTPPTSPGAGSLELASHPNPFGRTTAISFSVDRAGPTRLSIFDSSGRRVRRLWHSASGPGRFEVAWSGENDLGRPLPKGVYYAVLSRRGVMMTRKIVLAR